MKTHFSLSHKIWDLETKMYNLLVHCTEKAIEGSRDVPSGPIRLYGQMGLSMTKGLTNT